jgi:hypothetical protein
MSQEFKKGDRVTWNSHGGSAEGEVLRKIIEDTELAGWEVRASKDDPQYLVTQRQERWRGGAQTVSAEEEGLTAMAAEAE